MGSLGALPVAGVHTAHIHCVLMGTYEGSVSSCHQHPANLLCAAGICTVLGTLPMLWLVNANVAAMPALTVIFAFLSGALSGTVGPNMRCGGTVSRSGWVPWLHEALAGRQLSDGIHCPFVAGKLLPPAHHAAKAPLKPSRCLPSTLPQGHDAERERARDARHRACAAGALHGVLRTARTCVTALAAASPGRQGQAASCAG